MNNRSIQGMEGEFSVVLYYCSSYVVGARKAAKQIANARKLHCPVQLYASVLDHASMNS